MNKREIARLSAIAIDKLKSHAIVKDKTSIESKYYGYISSFGPTIYQSGIIPAILSYHKPEDKKHILDFIAELIEKKDLFSDIKKNHKEIKGLKTEFLEAITATKLAMMAFEKIKDKEKE